MLSHSRVVKVCCLLNNPCLVCSSLLLYHLPEPLNNNGSGGEYITFISIVYKRLMICSTNSLKLTLSALIQLITYTTTNPFSIATTTLCYGFFNANNSHFPLKRYGSYSIIVCL